MTVQRKVPPKPVQWDQRSILNAISRVGAALGLTVSTATPVTTDSSALSVRGVNDTTVISAIQDLQPVLERIEAQLRLITGDEDHAST